MAGGRGSTTPIPTATPSSSWSPPARRPEVPGLRPIARLSKRILHAGLTIKDAAAADRFYKEALGFSEDLARRPPRRRRSTGSTCASLTAPTISSTCSTRRAADRQQLGSAHHVALLVTDIQQALETVRAGRPRTIRNHRANPNIGVNNRWQLNLFDPDGTRVELMEPWPMRAQSSDGRLRY